MNEEREEVLRKLREAAEQGPHSEAFYQMMRRATRFGPVPNELFRGIWERHLAARKAQGRPLIPPEREEAIRAGLRRLHEPSARARDPTHPVGAVAKAIREALPPFELWQIDVSKIDLNAAAEKLCDDRAQALSYLLPPGFTDESSGLYIAIERGPLIEDDDGSVLTVHELIERKATQEAFRERMQKGSRLSDALKLAWKQPEPLELRAVEEFLRDLAEKVVPGVPVRFLPRQAPPCGWNSATIRFPPPSAGSQIAGRCCPRESTWPRLRSISNPGPRPVAGRSLSSPRAPRFHRGHGRRGCGRNIVADSGLLSAVVISTEGRRPEWRGLPNASFRVGVPDTQRSGEPAPEIWPRRATRPIRSQISRLCFAPLDMTKHALATAFPDPCGLCHRKPAAPGGRPVG
jgi:hypothetical protein